MNWHKLSKIGVLVSKLMILFFILCLLAVLTINYIIIPYSIFLVGIEIAIISILSFGIIRMNTFKQKAPVQPPEHFNSANSQAILLWKNIDYEIDRYEEGSSYYFNRVRNYKYATIILAGLSTIVLGLDLGEIKIGFMDYTTFSKNMALVLGAIITVYSSLMVYWNVEKYWLINKTMVNKLRILRDDLEYLQSSKTLDEDKINQKIDEYKHIKETFSKHWEGALSVRNSQKNQN